MFFFPVVLQSNKAAGVFAPAVSVDNSVNDIDR
jgi:hypothetical protein